MPRRIVLLSGPVASGKTTLAESLAHRNGFHVIKTRHLIQELRGASQVRSELQQAGETLDQQTGGSWVADALVREAGKLSDDAELVVDSVRIGGQVDSIRQRFGDRVVHVHLSAETRVLASRWRERSPALRESKSYAQVRANPTEAQVDSLSGVADIVIDTKQSSQSDVLVRVASHLGLYGRSVERLVDVLVGGQYGSEGKGNVASYLAREYDVLVRGGGPNAGHKAYEEPEPYTFHHLPSGTRRSGAKIILSPGAVLRVPLLLREISDCRVSGERLSIDPQAMVIEESDVRFEDRLTKSIGSTGQGVGAATARKILRTAAKPRVRLAKDVPELRAFVRESRPLLDEAYARGLKVFIEGTQGTGLSLHHGHYPYVTSRETTVSGCLADAGVAPSRVRKIIMVCRSYPIRVQSPEDATSGPMANEITWAEVARRSGIPAKELRSAERTSTTKKRRRVAEFDWTLLRRAASLNGPTDVALTFVDYLNRDNKDARRFEQLSDETIRFIEEVERVSAAPVSLIATRFHVRSVIDRRAW